MNNPFLINGFLSSNASINRIIINKSPIKELNGKAVSEIFSLNYLLSLIKHNSSLLEIDYDNLSISEILNLYDSCLTNEDKNIRKIAIKITEKLGENLGYILYTLKKGILYYNNESNWNKEHWEYWNFIENIFIAGGLANFKFSKIMLSCTKNILTKNNIKCNLAISMYPNILPLIGASIHINSKNKKALAFDFGQSSVKRCLAYYVNNELSNIKLIQPIQNEYKYNKNIDDISNAYKLNRFIINSIIDTFKQNYNSHMDFKNTIAISIANYVNDGKLSERGTYGILTLIDDNYEEYISKELSKILNQEMRVIFIHDGTSSASVYNEVPKTALLTLGTAIGVGFADQNKSFSKLSNNLLITK